MKKITSKQALAKLAEYLWVTVAGILNAVSLAVFVNPSTLIPGGFSGLASVFSYIIESVLPNVNFNSVYYIIYGAINLPLLICSLVMLRGDFTFKTIWATAVSIVVLAFIPENFKFDAPKARIIAVIFGGVMIGLAMYIANMHNGSNGGTEVIARIVAKYRPEVDLSKVIMIANFSITIVGSVVVMIVKDNVTVDIILYSIMYILIGGTVMGMFKRGFNHPQKFCIVTTAYEEIGLALTEKFKRGYTTMDVENSFDGQKRKMIAVVVQYRQMQHLKQIIKRLDPHAFTFVKDVYDVFSRPTFNRSYKTK
ncbi:MAG: YitT family protein [Corallococcus sp.]|nr:YitT family protein [Corallococcus sp.]MCM1359771.1 YitT family protein [Corallococcus sp.]MCM1395703.1 YitT family protein [Corallococcus sp.]